MSLSLFKKFRSRVVILLLILTPALAVQSASHVQSRPAARTFVTGVLYVKYRTGGAENSSQSASARSLLQQFHPVSETRPFAMRAAVQPDVQFASVYKYTFSAPTDVASLAAQLEKNPAIEYAEPSYVHYLDGTNVLPNDPLYANQWHLAKILADTAWSICAGDASIIIGIVDSGTDYLHADLMPNTKRSTPP